MAVVKFVCLFYSGCWSKWQRTGTTRHGDVSPTQATVPSDKLPVTSRVASRQRKNGHLERVHNAHILPVDDFRIQHDSISRRLTLLNLALTKNPHTWLRRSDIFPETEEFLFAVPDEVFPTRCYLKYIIKDLNVVNNACRLCASSSETCDCFLSKSSSNYL